MVAVAGLRVRVPVFTPGAPICRHWMDSFCCTEHDSVSTPFVSRTWVLSTRVVGIPPMVMVTVGATVIGVQLPIGAPLVSKLLRIGLLVGGFSVRITLWPAGTVNEPQRLNTLPPGSEEWSSTETLPIGISLELELSRRIAPASKQCGNVPHGLEP